MICAQLVSQLCPENRVKTQILDIGCGKGYVGQYLKETGFLNIQGIDCSKNLLQQAQQKNCYHTLGRFVFGQSQNQIPEQHIGKYDFITVNSMINNNDYDEVVFTQILDCLKIGGFAIFATKLNYHNQNQYEQEIKKLEEDGYWKFTAEHTFYRYDKLCEKVGKFSTKLVKILAYQKNDYEQWLADKEREKQEALRLAEEKKKAEHDEYIKQLE